MCLVIASTLKRIEKKLTFIIFVKPILIRTEKTDGSALIDFVNFLTLAATYFFLSKAFNALKSVAMTHLIFALSHIITTIFSIMTLFIAIF